MRLLLTSILSVGSIVCSPAALSSHAVISLKDGGQLTGVLYSIDTNGHTTIHSPLSHVSLELIHSSVQDITFSDKATTSKHTSEVVNLHNGDSLPCSLLSIDRTSLTLKTWYSESFKIPTSTVSDIQFHTKPDSLVYSGPNTEDIWDSDTNWTQNTHGMQCIGNGEFSRTIDLPQNFIFKSTVTWESARPIFTIYFCADSSQSENMVNAYSLEFSTNNIHIVRSSKSQPRAQIGEIPLRLRELSSNKLDIELHVDRLTQTIAVSLNGEKYGFFDDTSFRVPSGKFINFESNLQKNTDSLTVSNISISQWRGSNLSSVNEIAEVDLDLDSLYDTEGLKYTGQIQKTDKGIKALYFEVKHSSKPMVVPLSHIQSLYFADSSEN
ncbi:MAG: hypothetical protein ABGY95_07805, partial [Rubritalea sp.]|uniref:hypothetical protein n=1 Tax=Rubritalea sp. TaxID=2109375 RepID=UPI003241E4BC